MHTDEIVVGDMEAYFNLTTYTCNRKHSGALQSYTLGSPEQNKTKS